MTTATVATTFSLHDKLRAVIAQLGRDDIRRVYHFSRCLAGASPQVVEARILLTRLLSYRTPHRR